jgi:hypothetical protein
MSLGEVCHGRSIDLSTEHTDQYITDPKNHSSARFTFLINKFQSFFVLVHPNIPGQYITNIRAEAAARYRIELNDASVPSCRIKS